MDWRPERGKDTAQHLTVEVFLKLYIVHLVLDDNEQMQILVLIHILIHMLI